MTLANPASGYSRPGLVDQPTAGVDPNNPGGTFADLVSGKYGPGGTGFAPGTQFRFINDGGLTGFMDSLIQAGAIGGSAAVGGLGAGGVLGPGNSAMSLGQSGLASAGGISSGLSAADQAAIAGFNAGMGDTSLPGSQFASAGQADAGGVTLGNVGTGAAPTSGFGGGPLDALNAGASGTAAGLSAAGGAAGGTGGGFLSQMVSIPGLGQIPLSSLLTGGQLLSSGLGALGSISSANTLANAANNATGLQNQIYNQTQKNLAPYRNVGTGALNTLGGYLNASPTGGPGGGAGLLHPFGASDLNANLAPNYNFQLGQGLGQIQNQNAATGGVMGGNSLAGLNSFAQNYAQNAYQNAFQNYTTNQNNIYSRLGNLAQLGQQSATASASGAPLFASGMSNTLTGAGSALAGGTVGATNAATGGLSNLMGYYTLGAMTGQ